MDNPGSNDDRPIDRERWRWLAWGGLTALLVIGIPPFLCMPLTGDTIFYDLQVRNLHRGGTLYKEIFETNLCGAVWMHFAVRSLLGWSSEAIRLADLLIFGGVVLLLARWLARLGGSVTTQVVAATVMVLCYFSLSEWSHCQRDTWMLCFALAALELRYRQALLFANEPTVVPSQWRLAFCEGLLWSFGFWIKPFVAVPAAICWLHSLWPVRHRHGVVMANGAALLLGGVVSGAVGIGWLAASGAWPHFIDTQWHWNPGYFSQRSSSWLPLLVGAELWPWWCLHLLAVPAVLCGAPSDTARRGVARGLLAAFYLAWLVQSFGLQWWHPYVHVPGLLLAIAACASLGGQVSPAVWRLSATALVVIALLSSPLLSVDRWRAWPLCLTEGSTPRVRDLLRLPYDSWYRGTPASVDLERIADYLRARQVGHGEVTCYQWSTMQLYFDLDLQPPCRFVCPRIYAMGLFPDRKSEIRALLEQSPQRFVVSDLDCHGLPREFTTAVGPEGPAAPPPIFPRNVSGMYPWSHPVVFRSGRYMVHEVTPPLGEFAELSLLAPVRREGEKTIVEIGIHK